MTYSEYLAANGATPEEIKLLDVPVARKAFERAEADRLKAETDATNLRKWYEEEAAPAYKTMEQKMIEARADAARNAELVKAAQDQGLLEVAARAGIDPKDLAKPGATPGPGAFDEEKFFRDKVLPLAQQEGDAIALVQDIAFEHSRLFPDRPLNFRELRREAQSQRKSLEALWMEKYNVVAAREARSAAEKKAHEDNIRKQERETVLAEVASRYGNPDARPLAPSMSPLAARPSTGRDKMPWDADGNALAQDRVKRATESLVKSMVH
jgi:hypothetical protein